MLETRAPAAPPAPAPPSPDPIVPDEVERLELPGVYAGLWVDVWLNPPDAWLAGLGDMTNAAFLATLIKRWHLGTDPAPAITETAITRLPRKLLTYIVDQYWERYNRPLVPPTSAPSGPTTPTAAPSTLDGAAVSAPPPISSLPGSPTSGTPNGSA